MAFPLKQLWDLGRRIEDLFKLQDENKTAFDEIDNRFRALETTVAERLRDVEDRLLKLVETGQTQVISDAKTAATAAAMMISNSALSERTTRLTRVEMRVERIERIEQGPLPPPPACS